MIEGAVRQRFARLAGAEMLSAKARFVTYLYCRVRGRVCHFLESERRRHHLELVGEGMLADMTGGEADDPSDAVTAHEILYKLGDKERLLLRGHLAAGKSVRQVSGEMGCSHVHLFSVRDRAVARVRRRHPTLMMDRPEV